MGESDEDGHHIHGKAGAGGVGFVNGADGSGDGFPPDGNGGDGGAVSLNGGGKGGPQRKDGAGGGFGGDGGDAEERPGTGGKAYGDLALVLQGGSGGGGGGGDGLSGSGGGGGGGAVELGASGDIFVNGAVIVNGGRTLNDITRAGGGGGGGIIVHGNSVSFSASGLLSAAGGSVYAHGAGGGGRICIIAPTIKADLTTSVTVAGGGSIVGAGSASAGVLTTIGTVEPLNTAPQVVCPASATFDCAPRVVTMQTTLNDPDPDQTLILTLKEGAAILDSKSVVGPVNNVLVAFNPVTLAAGTHSLTIEVDDGSLSASCSTSVTVAPDATPPLPDLLVLPVITGGCEATVTTVPTATDACGGKVIATTQDPLSYTSQGTFVIRWNFDDGNGNTTLQIQIVSVKDAVAPLITYMLRIRL
jgi:hypothetical protein